jgi:hypothetical protein
MMAILLAENSTQRGKRVTVTARRPLKGLNTSHDFFKRRGKMIKRKGVIEIDKYTKVVLTVIAVLLALYLVKPWFVPKQVMAYGATDVNIATVGGKSIKVGYGDFGYGVSGVPVYITNPR